jgi:hypothetical protein
VVLASEHRVNNLRWAIAGLTFAPVEPAIASFSKIRPVVGDRLGQAILSVRLPTIGFGIPAHLGQPVQFTEDIQPASAAGENDRPSGHFFLAQPIKSLPNKDFSSLIINNACT